MKKNLTRLLSHLAQRSVSWRGFVALALLAVFASIFFQSMQATNSYAAGSSGSGTVELHGWAWADTIGWISFNSADPGAGASSGASYSVKEAADGTLSGNAWSPNIGWISFNDNGCPSGVSGISGSCQPKVNLATGQVTGWARALSACQSSLSSGCTSGSAASSAAGGWDGWISLNGFGYGVKQNGGVWSGYAWGGGTQNGSTPGLGWINTNYTTSGTPPTTRCVYTSATGSCTPVSPSLTLSATPSTVLSGTSATLSWSSTHTSSCLASGAWSGTKATSGSQSVTQLVNKTTPFTYTLTCLGAPGIGKSVTKSVTVTVNPISSSPPSTGSGSTPAVGTLHVFPTMVNRGVPTKITFTWNITPPTGTGTSLSPSSCEIKNRATGSAVISTLSSLSSSIGSGVSQTLTHQTAYELVCGSSVLSTAVVNLVPQYSPF